MSDIYYCLVILFHDQCILGLYTFFYILFLLKRSYRVIFWSLENASRWCIFLAKRMHLYILFSKFQMLIYSLELCSCFRVVWHSCEKKKSYSLSLFLAKALSEDSAVEILSRSNSSPAAESFSDFGLMVVSPPPLSDLK